MSEKKPNNIEDKMKFYGGEEEILKILIKTYENHEDDSDEEFQDCAVYILKKYKELQQENKKLKNYLNDLCFSDENNDVELPLRYLRKIGYVDFDEKQNCYINKHNNELLNEENEKKKELLDSENILTEFEKWLQDTYNYIGSTDVSKIIREYYFIFNIAEINVMLNTIEFVAHKLQELKEGRK